MKNLHLILKKEWFDKIQSGEKKIEYRAATHFWERRLWNWKFDIITFHLGYAKNAPRIEKKFIKTELEIIKHEFFGNEEILVFAIYFE